MKIILNLLRKILRSATSLNGKKGKEMGKEMEQSERSKRTKRSKKFERFEVPDEYKNYIVAEVGSYSFAQMEDGHIYIIGKRVKCLTREKIKGTCLLPYTKQMLIEQDQEPDEFSFFNVFDLEDDVLYYLVMYGDDMNYIFNDLEEALTFAGNLVSIKSLGMVGEVEEVEK